MRLVEPRLIRFPGILVQTCVLARSDLSCLNEEIKK